MLFELGTNVATAKAIIAHARTLAPGKPVTQALDIYWVDNNGHGRRARGYVPSERLPHPAQLRSIRPRLRPGAAAACAPAGRRGWRWADVRRRVFAVDVLACPGCGGRLRLVATLEASDTTRRILRHRRLPTDVPPPAPWRAPPRVHDSVA